MLDTLSDCVPIVAMIGLRATQSFWPLEFNSGRFRLAFPKKIQASFEAVFGIVETCGCHQHVRGHQLCQNKNIWMAIGIRFGLIKGGRFREPGRFLIPGKIDRRWIWAPTLDSVMRGGGARSAPPHRNVKVEAARFARRLHQQFCTAHDLFDFAPGKKWHCYVQLAIIYFCGLDEDVDSVIR